MRRVHETENQCTAVYKAPSQDSGGHRLFYSLNRSGGKLCGSFLHCDEESGSTLWPDEINAVYHYINQPCSLL